MIKTCRAIKPTLAALCEIWFWFNREHLFLSRAFIKFWWHPLPRLKASWGVHQKAILLVHHTAPSLFSGTLSKSFSIITICLAETAEQSESRLSVGNWRNVCRLRRYNYAGCYNTRRAQIRASERDTFTTIL